MVVALGAIALATGLITAAAAIAAWHKQRQRRPQQKR